MKPTKLSEYKLKDFFGKPLKKSYLDPEKILEELNIKERCMLDCVWPHTLEVPIMSTPNVHEIQKWEGKGKGTKAYIFIVKDKNRWYRLATKEESKVFKA